MEKELYFLLVSFLLFVVLFLSQIFFRKFWIRMQHNQQTKLFWNVNFYKIPIRWAGLVLLWLLSWFRENEKIYIKHALKKPFHYTNLDKELWDTLGKVRNYTYALFIFHTIYYFQKIRYEKDLKTKKQSMYFGFLGYGNLHCDAYHCTSNEKLKHFHNARFHFQTWIPEVAYQYFLQKENSIHTQKAFQAYLHQKSFEQQLADYHNLAVETRTIGKKPKRRFDFSKQKNKNNK